MPIPFIIAGVAAITAAVGGKKALDGYKTKSKANDIMNTAETTYKKREVQIKSLMEISEKKLEQLGSLELSIGNSFTEFQKVSQELLNKLEKEGSTYLKLSIPQNRLNKIEELNISTTEFLKTIVASGATGAAASFAVYCGVMTFAAASTGTPIAALSGAAAYNATMAAIGGGSLAAGGWGMAGGAIILGGAAIAPILAIAGWAYDKHAKKALKNANEIKQEVSDAIKKMDFCDNHLTKTNNYVSQIHSSLEKINQTFNEYFLELKEMHKKIIILGGEKATSDISQKSLRIINNGYLLAAIMTDIITTPLFKPKNVSQDGIVEIETDNEGFNVLNTEALDSILSAKEKEYSNLIIKA